MDRVLVDDKVRSILDSLYDGALVADMDGVVCYIDPAYTRITGVTEARILGKSLEEIRPGARLPFVIKSGESRIGVIREMGDVQYIVNMTPIIWDEVVVGGISLVLEPHDIYKLTDQLNQSKRLIEKLKSHMNAMRQTRYGFDDILAVDSAAQSTKAIALKIAQKELNVLITGESGTGKELYAHAIHDASPRRNGPFLAVNCASFESTLLESELFGYEEGAFTGAKKGGKLGLFELAGGGTLFLDEIGEMDYALQAKLLRVLQEKRIRRIGGGEEIDIDVRVISATNRDLNKMVEAHTFRRDLYYRVAVFPITILPLRERRDDIDPMIDHFLNLAADKLKRSLILSDSARRLLRHYSWPGNIRELKNAIDFAANMTDDFNIEIEHLPKLIRAEGTRLHLVETKSLDQVVREAEHRAISEALFIFGDTVEGKKKASEHLGISLATLYNKMK
jgi:transcriptional regulator with PAS, ATPase and Fis domain